MLWLDPLTWLPQATVGGIQATANWQHPAAAALRVAKGKHASAPTQARALCLFPN